MSTWLISLEYIKKQNPAAADFLFLMSFVDRQGIPTSLLPAEDYNPVDYIDAIGILEAFSLIQSMHEKPSYDIHRLVQLATRTWIRSLEAEKWKSKASQSLRPLSSRFLDATYKNRSICAAYLPHADTVLNYNLTVDQSLIK